MRGQTTGEMRMELAEHLRQSSIDDPEIGDLRKREQQRLRDSISDVCYGCVAGGDDTRQVPEDVDHHAAGDFACAYHWPEDEAGEFPEDTAG